MNQATHKPLPSFIFGHSLHCAYCGDPSQSLDHVIPLSYETVERSRDIGPKVYCCLSCNSVLRNLFFTTFDERCVYIRNRMERRAKAILWTDAEIKTLDHSLQRYVERKRDANRWYRNRADWYESRDYVLNLENLTWQTFLDPYAPSHHEHLHAYFSTTLYQIRELYRTRLYETSP